MYPFLCESLKITHMDKDLVLVYFPKEIINTKPCQTPINNKMTEKTCMFLTIMNK